MLSPTALNKRGTRMTKYGETFASAKELAFYERFIYGQVQPKCVAIHPHFVLAQAKPIQQGAKIHSIRYTPDFIIYDVKNSFGIYGISNANKLTFRLFAMHTGVPVEAVVVRQHDFKAACIGVTKPLNLTGKAHTPAPIVCHDVFYNWKEATNYDQ